MGHDPGLELEDFICYELPYLLNLSPSKQAAVHLEFSRSADLARPLARKQPEEFRVFLENFFQRFRSVQYWRAPMDNYVGIEVERDDQGISHMLYWPNGKPRYRLYPKTKGMKNSNKKTV